MKNNWLDRTVYVTEYNFPKIFMTTKHGCTEFRSLYDCSNLKKAFQKLHRPDKKDALGAYMIFYQFEAMLKTSKVYRMYLGDKENKPFYCYDITELLEKWCERHYPDPSDNKALYYYWGIFEILSNAFHLAVKIKEDV